MQASTNISFTSRISAYRTSLRIAMKMSFAIALLLGITLNLSAQSLSWLTPSSVGVTISGVSTRETPAAAVFSGEMYVAYTSTSVADSYGNKYVYVGHGTGQAYSGFAYISPSAGVAASNANPSMVKFGTSLFLAFNSAGASGTESANIVSFNGTSWGAVTGLPIPNNVSFSPSLATDGTYLYVGLLDASTRTMTLCKSSNGTTFTCTNFASSLPTELGYNPGLAYFNGVLYAGWVTNANSHDEYYYTSTNQGASWSTSSALDGNQSSVAPHLGVHGADLRFDVRTNDDSHKFSQRYSSNGTSWSSGSDAHINMGGEPGTADGFGLSTYSGYYYLFYCSDDGNHTLYVTIGS